MLKSEKEKKKRRRLKLISVCWVNSTLIVLTVEQFLKHYQTWRETTRKFICGADAGVLKLVLSPFWKEKGFYFIEY